MLRGIEMALAAFSFILLTGTNFHYPLLGIPADLATEEELAPFQGIILSIFLLAYVMVLMLTVLNWRKMILGMAAVWPITVLIVLVWLSVLWSVDPETTNRRAIAITITTLMGIYLFVRFDFEDMLRFLSICFAMLVIGSLAWLVLFPDFAIHADEAHAGSWRGVFFHKNTAGREMVFGLAIIIAAWHCRCLNRAFLSIIGVLALLVIVGTTSKTALIGLLALVLGFVFIAGMRGAAIKSAMITLALFAIAWHLALLAFFTYEDVLLFLGRDPTLTGRTELWAYALRVGFEAPLTGYGYDAFWSGEFSPGARYVIEWGIGQSHNSWIEVFVNLGLPAVIILFGVMLTMMFRAVVLSRYYPSVAPAILIAQLSFTILTIGMTESLFLVRHTIYWMLLVAAVGCARALTSGLSMDDQVETRNDRRVSPADLGRSESY